MKGRPWLALPAASWFLFFLLAPLGIVAFYSLCAKGTYGGVVVDLSFRNFERAFDPLYLGIFLSSLELALGTTVACLLVGFPVAYALATAPRAWRNLLLLLVVVPFWTNLVVRAYGLKILLGERGPVNDALLWLGLVGEPVVFANRPVSVWIGMVTNYLPFMVLPLYVALEKFDFTLLEAARDLGASSRQAFLGVMVPLLKRGIASGSVFVFAPALGEFVIPDLLGGARTMLVGNLITDQFLKARDWPFGASLSLLLIFAVTASLAAWLRVERAGT